MSAIDLRAAQAHEAIAWRGALIHHSATAPTATVQSIRDYHVKHNGWQDIGYHGLIALRPDGRYRFEAGRSLAMAGAHCPGKNRSHLGLCLIGNFEHSTPPLAQLEVAAEVLAEWCVAFGFGTEDIHPHRAFRQTQCPGLVDILGLRARVAAILAEG